VAVLLFDVGNVGADPRFGADAATVRVAQIVVGTTSRRLDDAAAAVVFVVAAGASAGACAREAVQRPGDEEREEPEEGGVEVRDVVRLESVVDGAGDDGPDDDACSHGARDGRGATTTDGTRS